MKPKLKGVLFGTIAAIAYGTNPLFSLPLYAEGMTPASVLFYRYTIAAISLGLMLLCKGESLKIKKREILPLMMFGILFAFSSLLLFQSFLYMDAGIASTILFVYPILVAVLMSVFFHEKGSKLTYGCIGFAFIGILLLYKGDGNSTLNMTGMIWVTIAAFVYAVYIIVIDRFPIRGISSAKMTFWIITFGTFIFIAATGFMTQLQPIPPTLSGWTNVLGLAIVPTIISIMFINISIKHIGATYAAIIGALEPVTALAIGIVIFDEVFTISIAIGVLLILIAVTLVVSGDTIIAGVTKKRCNHTR